MRVTKNLVPAGGEAEAFDPAEPARFAALAGERLLRLEGDTAVILNDDGSETVVYPGWVMVLPDGAGPRGAQFHAPGRIGEAAGCSWQAA
jgi:hypothetical protein